MRCFDGVAPPPRLMKAFRIINSHLWSSIAKTAFHDGTYSRCVLTSCAITEFLRGKGYHAEVVPAILEVSLRRNKAFESPNIVGIGEPTAAEEGLHVVCKVTETNGRMWIVDGTTRQASRPGRWREPPEGFVVEAFQDKPPTDPDDHLVKLGYRLLASMQLPDNDGTHLLFRWFSKDGLPDTWRRVADAALERSSALKRGLDSAWLRKSTA